MIEALAQFMDTLAMAIGYTIMVMAFSAGLVYLSFRSLLRTFKVN